MGTRWWPDSASAADETLTMFDFSGQTVVVTGASRGIGWQVIHAFLDAGADVLACGRHARPHGLNEKIHWIAANVSDAGDVQNLFAYAEEQMGHVDILVNNAGIQIEKTIDLTTDDDWNQLMGVNAHGVFLMCRQFVQRADQSGGSIINIGSVSGERADPELALYNASKAFVHGLTRSIAVDHGSQRIRCNAISPGWIDTGMADAAFAAAASPDAAKTDALARHPAGRFGQPADIASTALWLASEHAAFITGQCITVDGGLMSGSPIRPQLF